MFLLKCSLFHPSAWNHNSSKHLFGQPLEWGYLSGNNVHRWINNVGLFQSLYCYVPKQTAALRTK